MSNTRTPEKLLTIPEFLKAFPSISENQLRWALRHRDSNGLHKHCYRRASWRPLTTLLDPEPVALWFARTVRA